MSSADDWADDAMTYEGEGAFVTLTFPSGYTDFDLTPDQVSVVFSALISHAGQ